jgi:prepilin-type processing-associated H-X9-DG protein
MSANFENDPEFNESIPKPSTTRGSRLLESLAVLGILVLLIALLLPATRSSREAARRSQCVNNLKDIALALRNYEETHKALPPAFSVDAKGRPLHSWRTLILPYLEQGGLYQTIDLTKPWDDPANARAMEAIPSVYRCPSAVGPPGMTAYLAVVSPRGCLAPGRSRPLAEITDPHDSTLMLIEAGDVDAVPWMAPVDASESLVLGLGPSKKLHHSGGMNACLVDGSVRFLKASIPARVRRALMTISGDDPVSANEW